MRRIGTTMLIVFSLLGAAWACLASARGPITILGNADFTEENGVLSGEGTQDDPYIIAGWQITVPSGARHGVKIENVTASFVLRGLVIDAANEIDGAAIRVGLVAGGVIENCVIGSSVNGVEVASSTGMLLRGNTIYVMGSGLRVTGESKEEYHHAIDASNLLNGLPIHYYYGLDGERIEGVETKHLTVAASRDVTIMGCSVLDGDGISLAFVTDSAVAANVAGRDSNVPTGHAISLYESQRNVVTANLLKNTRLAGVQLTFSSENEIVDNLLPVNDTGVRMVASSGNIVRGNEFLGCYTAVWVSGASEGNHIEQNTIVGKVKEDGDMRQGIMLELAYGNLIVRNGLTDCEFGVSLEAEATANEVVENTIVSGAYGIFLSGSYNRIEGNLITQQSRGIIFPETYGQSTTKGNVLLENVLADNGHHVYTNFDSEGNEFGGNIFLGNAQVLVADQGLRNRWSIEGIGNYWGEAAVADADRDGFADDPVTVYRSGAQDASPLASFDAADLRIGVLATLPTQTVRIERSDGTVAEVEARIAAAGVERWVGYRGLPAALLEGFPGVLFVFDAEADLRFTMVTVPFDLDIAFFDAEGGLVGNATMTAMSRDLYAAKEPSQYALEVVGGRLSEFAIGERARLRLPPGS